MKEFFRWGNLVMLVAMIVVNSLANTLPIGGYMTGEISEQYPTLFTPAPYTFAIWGVIYIMMSIFAIYIAVMPPQNGTITVVRDHVGFLFMISCLFNIAWIFTWHYEKIGLSVLCIIGLLITLIYINMHFTVHPTISIFERISIYGFNVYLGWICAATIANICVLLEKIGWTGFGLSDQTWTIIVLVIAGLLGVLFSLMGGRFMASFAILWAVAGIFVKHISASGYNNAYPMITITSVCVFIVVSTCILIAPILNSVPVAQKC